jgi:hypothetical protein
MFGSKTTKTVKIKKLSGLGKLFSDFGRDPKTDWSLILLLFVIIIVVLVCFSAFLLLEVKKGSIFLSVKKEPFRVETLNAGELKKTIQFYEAKGKRFEELKVKTPGI